MNLHFAGLARDCASTLLMNLRGLIGIAEHPQVKSASLTIAVNNSRDKTLDLLRRFESIGSNIRVMDLGDLDSRYPMREARIAFCRDRLLDRIDTQILEQGICLSEEDLYIPIDLDSEIGSSISPSQFIAECQRVIGGSANGVFPVSAPFYYDIYALRSRGWVEKDCLDPLKRLQESDDPSRNMDNVFSDIALYQKPIGELQRQKLISVDSAFGGIGIYSYTSIRGRRYLRDELIRGEAVCEHLIFNRQIEKLFISTDFVVKAPHEHIFRKLQYEEQSFLALTATAEHLSEQKRLDQQTTLLHGAAGDFTVDLPATHPWPNYISSIPLYDRFFPHLCTRLVPGVIIDIGANIGDTICMIRAAGCDNKIIAVEPEPMFLSFLEKNIKNNLLQDIDVYPFPISSTHKAVLLSQDIRSSTANARLEQPGQEQRGNDAILYTRTFCDILNDLKLPSDEIRAIKIDTDGYDWDVLKSIYNWLAQHPEPCKAMPFIFYEHQTYLTTDGPFDKSRTEREHRFINALRDLQDFGYSNYFAFDNFGTIIAHTSDLDVLADLSSYPGRSERINNRHTVYYLDVLLCTEGQLKTVQEAITDYSEQI